MSIINMIRKHAYIIALFAIVFVVYVANYVPGTWLTGWDNLHSEFNFSLNIHRSLLAVWQEYQGLGLLGGMGHASDLLRELLLYPFSFVLPQSFLRYFFHFVMLFVGVFGVYTILDTLLLAHSPKRMGKKAAFLGALFYLLNLGTIQYFYTPFEPYSTF